MPDEAEVDWRAPLHPAGAAGGDQGTSDDEEVWWEQSWHGGAILRDGVPPDTVGVDLALLIPLKSDGDSLTSSRAAAASRRS
eukprot:8287909-Pyramimonas_sp.AAC.1